MKEKKSFLDVKEIVEIALLVSLGIILDLDGLKISLGSSGGSIGFTMLPLMILVLRHGVIKGLVGVGLIYGLTTNLLDGWGLIYYPFDYFVAYGISISLLGFFAKKIFSSDVNIANYLWLIIGVLLVGSIRVFGHTLSSLIFYKYTLGAALSYNLVYVGPSIMICLLVLCFMLKTLIVLNKRFSTCFLKKVFE